MRAVLGCRGRVEELDVVPQRVRLRGRERVGEAREGEEEARGEAEELGGVLRGGLGEGVG